MINESSVKEKVYKVSENGFSMTDDKVSVPACEITASSYLEAQKKLSDFLSSGKLTDDIKLITPIERISFE